MTGAAAAAETPSRSSNFFTSCAASNRLSPTIDSSNCCRSAMSLSPKLIYRLCCPDLSSQVSSTASAPDKCLPYPLTTHNQTFCRSASTTWNDETFLLGSRFRFLEFFLLPCLIDHDSDVAAHGIHHRDQTL